MGDEHERNAQMALQELELVLNALAQIGIERTQRLIEKQDIRLDHKGAGERDALLLPARQSLRLKVADVGQAKFFQNALHHGVALGYGHLLDVKTEANICAHGHVRKQRVVLEDHR